MFTIYMHILPFDILERNLITLGSIMFRIARAYFLIVIASVDCRIIAWCSPWLGCILVL